MSSTTDLRNRKLGAGPSILCFNKPSLTIYLLIKLIKCLVWSEHPLNNHSLHIIITAYSQLYFCYQISACLLYNLSSCIFYRCWEIFTSSSSVPKSSAGKSIMDCGLLGRCQSMFPIFLNSKINLFQLCNQIIVLWSKLSNDNNWALLSTYSVLDAMLYMSFLINIF